MQYICSLKAAEKHVSANNFKENLHTSVKILQICMDLQDSVQRSLQNPAEKILQICTDSRRSKTWALSTRLFEKLLDVQYIAIYFYTMTKPIYLFSFSRLLPKLRHELHAVFFECFTRFVSGRLLNCKKIKVQKSLVHITLNSQTWKNAQWSVLVN